MDADGWLDDAELLAWLDAYEARTDALAVAGRIRIDDYLRLQALDSFEGKATELWVGRYHELDRWIEEHGDE